VQQIKTGTLKSEDEGAAAEPRKKWGHVHLNNLKNIFLVVPALTGITS